MLDVVDEIKLKLRSNTKLKLHLSSSDSSAENMEEVYEAGKKAENNEFWDNYLGDMETCYEMFCSTGWSVTTFKPNKVIRPIGNAEYMFSCFCEYGEAFDMVEHLEKLGSGLDTSQVEEPDYMFSYANILRLGVLDFSSATNLDSTFRYSTIEIIDELIMNEDIRCSYTFGDCSELRHMVVSGTIGQRGFDVSACTLLDKESIASIIDALSTTKVASVTLSETAVNNAFETSQSAADGVESIEWATLIATKPNWTISLK